MKSKLEIYALAICFASMITLVISLSIAGYGVFRIALPDLTINSYSYDMFQTNDAYWKRNSSSCSKNKEKKERPTEDELTKQRLAAYEIELKGERRDGFQSLIQCSLFIIISSLVLLIHWRIAKRARE